MDDPGTPEHSASADRPGRGARQRGPRCTWHHKVPSRGTCAECQRPICRFCTATEAGDFERELCPTCAPDAAIEPSVPFEVRGAPPWRSFWRTFKLVWTSPQSLFRAFPRYPIGRAVLFAYLAALPATILGTVVLGASVAAGRIDEDAAWVAELSEGLGNALYIAQPILGLLLWPVYAFFMAAIMQVPTMALGGRWGFATTYRMVCYTAPLDLAEYVPMCGGILYWVLVLAVLFRGMRMTHGLSIGRALVVVLVPVGTCIAFGIAAAVIIFALIVGGPFTPTPFGGGTGPPAPPPPFGVPRPGPAGSDPADENGPDRGLKYVPDDEG